MRALRTSIVAALGALTALAALGISSSEARTQSPPNTEAEFMSFLVGTWSCADTVGDNAGTYSTTIARTLDDRWLRQTYTWAPASESPKPLRGEYLISYDPRIRKWIRMGAMNDGMYFAMTGTLSGDTLTYGYVLPGTAGKALYIRKAESELRVIGPTYPENGRLVTERHACRKSP
jgi:hypothetical protein